MKGKIYIIRSHQTEDVYYGCTTQKYLSARFSCHKMDYIRWLNKQRNFITSFEIVKYEDAYIELVEEVEYETKEELKAREGFYIRNNNCINKTIPDRTGKEWRQTNYENNKEVISEKKKEHYQINKEKIIKKQKEYYEKNKDIINEKRRK